MLGERFGNLHAVAKYQRIEGGCIFEGIPLKVFEAFRKKS